MKLYITQNALNYGIYSIDCEIISHPNGIEIPQGSGPIGTDRWVDNNNVHLTFEAAINRAYQMKEEEIDKMLIQVEKVRKIDFHKTYHNYTRNSK